MDRASSEHTAGARGRPGSARSLGSTRAFYVDGLGFNVDWEHGFEPGLPVFAQLTRDGLSLFLTEHAGDCQAGGAAYFVVDDVDARR